MRSHSCIGKTYKKRDLIRVMDVLIKNVSVSVLDNVLWNSIEKLYRINKDFVRLSDSPTSEITKDDFWMIMQIYFYINGLWFINWFFDWRRISSTINGISTNAINETITGW
jgi:hypothetical protein